MLKWDSSDIWSFLAWSLFAIIYTHPKASVNLWDFDVVTIANVS